MPAALLAFIGTNLDDILVLTLLFAGETSRRGRLRIALGYALGVLILTLLSVLAALGLRAVPADGLRLLGLIPAALGVRAYFAKGEETAAAGTSLLGAALITLGSGADNLGVYIPLFARCTAAETALTALVFMIMAALWSLLAARLSALPALRTLIGKHRRIAVPAALILLGLYILFL